MFEVWMNAGDAKVAVNILDGHTGALLFVYVPCYYILSVWVRFIHNAMYIVFMMK